MDAIAAQPALNDLYALIDKISRYPVSATDIVAAAKRRGAPEEVVGFYDSFMPWLTFHNKDELIGCSEQVDILRAERSAMPQEEERAPEED